MFTFKQFHVDDTDCGMLVSTDGIFLGAWNAVPNAGRLLDIGCGCGLLSLMAAQQFDAISITALDIDSNAIAATKKNVANSPWPDRVSVVQADVLQWGYEQAEEAFTSIVCNPPYFVNSALSKDKARCTARHTQGLDFLSLMQVTAHLLSRDGVANFILPIKESEECIAHAKEQGLYLIRACYVKATPNKPITRLLFTLSKTPVEEPLTQEVTIRRNNAYSEEYTAITKDFYLKM